MLVVYDTYKTSLSIDQCTIIMLIKFKELKCLKQYNLIRTYKKQKNQYNGTCEKYGSQNFRNFRF